MADIFDTLGEATPTDTLAITGEKEREPSVGGDIFDRLAGGIRQPTEKEQPEQPLTQKLGERVITGVPGRNVAEFAARTAVSPFGAQVRAGGQLIGGIGDILATGAKKTFEALPEKGQQFIKDTAKSVGDLMSASSESLSAEGLATKTAIQALQSSTEAYQEVKAKDPELAADLESLINLATVAPAGKVGREVFDLATDVTNFATRNTIKKVDKQIFNTVKKNITKSVRTTGKKTFAQGEKFFKQSQDAVENIIANKDRLKLVDETGEIVSGRLPQNLEQFSESISQTKDQLFKEFDSLAKIAGDKQVTVPTNKIILELDNALSDGRGRLARLSPALANEVDRLSNLYKDIGTFTPKEAQGEIAALNESLQAFYKNPSPETVGKAYINSLVANNLRKNLDNAIQGATNSRYQALKNSYGSLSEIEKDVSKAFFKEAQRTSSGLVVDFGNVFSSTAALQGIFTANPSLALAAGTGKIVVDIAKKLRDPSRLVKNMFEETDALITKRNNLGFNPRSKLGKTMQDRITNAQKAEIAEQQRLSVEGLGGGVTQPRPTVQPLRQLPAGQGFQLQGKPFTPFPVSKQAQIGFEGQIPKQIPFDVSDVQLTRGKFSAEEVSLSARGIGARKGRTGKAIKIDPKEILTNDPFLDNKISIALSTPPNLRTPEQKLVIDLIVGGK